MKGFVHSEKEKFEKLAREKLAQDEKLSRVFKMVQNTPTSNGKVLVMNISMPLYMSKFSCVPTYVCTLLCIVHNYVDMYIGFALMCQKPQEALHFRELVGPSPNVNIRWRHSHATSHEEEKDSINTKAKTFQG